MKKVILVSLIVSIILIIILMYVNPMAQQGHFDANTIFAIAVLAGWALFSLISFILYQTGKKEANAKMWLFVVSSILTYLIVDLMAGFLLIPRLSPKMIPDQFVHHKLVPNTYSKFQTDEYAYIQRVNSFGLRGSDIQMKKRPDTYRILMLGDSFTMGKGVSDNHTFSFLLEKSLNDKNGTVNGKHFEVLNAGVDSYAPILSFIQLTEMAGQLEPDLVVLNLDMSDLVQETAYRNAATHGANGEIIGIDGGGKEYESKVSGSTEAARNWADRNLYITRLILFYLDKWTKNSSEASIRNMVALANPELLRHTLSEDKTDRSRQWQNIFDSFLHIKKYCDERNIRFLLTIYPWGHQVNKREWVAGRRLFIPDGALISDKTVHVVEDFAAKNNIKFLNVFPAFRSYRGTSPLYFNYDMHWTSAGHEVMARELERFIVATYFNNAK